MHTTRIVSVTSLVILLLAAEAATPQQLSGSVAGTVIDARTHSPVPGIRISVGEGSQTTTNDAGQFRVSNVRPGKQTIQAVRSGWATLLPDGSPATVTVKPGEEVRDLRLQLAPFGVVSGQIRDSDGKPVSGVLVQALGVSYREGRQVLVAPSQAAGIINSSTETEANGEYRLFLPPGVYYVCGQYRTARASEEADARAVSDSLKACYPGTQDLALAATLKLNSGEAPGIDFTVAAMPRELHKVHIHLEGRSRALITNMAGAQIGELRDRVTLDRIPIVGSLRRGSSTSSEMAIDGVPDGSFDLFIDGVMEDGVRGRGITSIDVRGRDLRDVRVTLQPPQDIAGRIFTSGPSLPLSGAMVLLGARRASVDANGTFTVSSVLAGYQSVSVEGLPPEAYVADIRSGGISLHETARTLNGPELEAGLASTPLEIVIDTNAGAIDGIVDGREAAAGATVVLVPPSTRRFVRSYYKATTAGPAGEFSFKGVPPGVYQLFTWDSVPDTAWLNPRFMSRWEGRGQAISVEAAGSINVHARLLHRED